MRQLVYYYYYERFMTLWLMVMPHPNTRHSFVCARVSGFVVIEIVVRFISVSIFSHSFVRFWHPLDPSWSCCAYVKCVIKMKLVWSLVWRLLAGHVRNSLGWILRKSRDNPEHRAGRGWENNQRRRRATFHKMVKVELETNCEKIERMKAVGRFAPFGK